MLDIESHGLQDAFLGLLDGLAETIDAGEIVAVGIVTLALAFDGDGVAVESHAEIQFTMKVRGQREQRQWRVATEMS
jgi:hypothetical protein